MAPPSDGVQVARAAAPPPGRRALGANDCDAMKKGAREPAASDASPLSSHVGVRRAERAGARVSAARPHRGHDLVHARGRPADPARGSASASSGCGQAGGLRRGRWQDRGRRERALLPPIHRRLLPRSQRRRQDVRRGRHAAHRSHLRSLRRRVRDLQGLRCAHRLRGALRRRQGDAGDDRRAPLPVRDDRGRVRHVHPPRRRGRRPRRSGDSAPRRGRRRRRARARQRLPVARALPRRAHVQRRERRRGGDEGGGREAPAPSAHGDGREAPRRDLAPRGRRRAARETA